MIVIHSSPVETTNQFFNHAYMLFLCI